MKKIFLPVFLYCCPLFLLAQKNVIKGSVKDSLNNPVPLVHVMILEADNFVVGTITDSLGNFTIKNLKNGSYLLKIAAIGYKDYTKEFVHLGGNRNFDNLQLQTESIALDEVELIARQKLYENRSNSLVINVEQNIAGSGGSVIDLLSNTAGVAVNQQNGTLSLNNRGKIAIMINGKFSRVDGQALISLLKSMPATSIKNLEVYHNPPSKYEANGSGGMINITTKSKSNDGQGGSISLISGYGKGEKTGASLNYHFQHKKLNWYGSYALNRNRTPEEWGVDSEFNNLMSQKKVLANSLRKPVINLHNYSVGVETSLLKNTNFGVSLGGYTSNWDMLAFDKVERDRNTEATEILNIETKEHNQWNHIGGNLFLEHSFAGEHTLTFEYAHLKYNYDNPSSYETQGQTEVVEIQKKTPINFNVFNLDYRGKLSENVQIEFGAKTTSSNFTNTIEVSSNEGGTEIIDDELSSATQMHEQIHAIYSSFEFQFGEKTRLTTGLRFEHTSNELDIQDSENTITRELDNLFPSLMLAHRINDVHRLQFNYGRRINRPTFDNLAPYVLFLGPEALYSGNANLQPSFVHKIGAEWRWSGKYISMDYLIENDPIVQFQPRLSTSGEQYIFKAENMEKRTLFSISMGAPFSIAPWWHSENNLTYQHESLCFNFQGAQFDRSRGSLRVSSSQQFSLGTETKLEVSGYYQSSALFGISTFGARGSLNLGIQQQLKKNYGSLKLSFSNILASDNWKIETSTEQPSINTLETYLPESRILTLTYTKNFGGNRKPKKFMGNAGDEEKKRVE